VKRTTRRGARGQVLVIAALLMTDLTGMLALLIDVGDAYAQRRFMQSAADAASIAAAHQLATSMQSGTTRRGAGADRRPARQQRARPVGHRRQPEGRPGGWVDPRTKPPLPGRLIGGSSQITGPVSLVLSR
jgi:hypothetical protein